MLCENRSVPYICERLGLATSTAKTHASRIYEKAGVHSRDALQLLATSRRPKAAPASGDGRPVGNSDAG